MPHQITITLDDAGQLSVNAPMQNKLLCYGMLDLARDVVKDAHDAAEKRAILPATGADLKILNGHPR